MRPEPLNADWTKSVPPWLGGRVTHRQTPESRWKSAEMPEKLNYACLLACFYLKALKNKPLVQDRTLSLLSFPPISSVVS